MFRQIHEHIAKREESFGRNLKSSCEHRELAGELQEWLREARHRLEQLDTSSRQSSRRGSSEAAALNAESTLGADHIATLERLEDDIAGQFFSSDSLRLQQCL